MKKDRFICNLNWEHNLEDLITLLKNNNIEEPDYKNVVFGLDHGACYYEGDTPEIKVNLINQK